MKHENNVVHIIQCMSTNITYFLQTVENRTSWNFSFQKLCNYLLLYVEIEKSCFENLNLPLVSEYFENTSIQSNNS